jgi:hypothetical protein
MVGYLSKKPKTFLWMIQENFTGKGDVQHKLEGPSKSPRESPPPSQDAGRPFKINEDGEDGDGERSSTPKGYQGKIHMRGVHRDEDVIDASGTTCQTTDW